MKTVVCFLILFTCNCKSFCQCIESGYYKIDSSDYKLRTKFNLVTSYFVREEFNKQKKGEENFIKFFAVQFYLDSNLNICNHFFRGTITQEIKSGLKSAMTKAIDSLKSRGTNLDNLRAKILYVPIIYLNKVNANKPALAVLSESDVFSIFNEPDACPPGSGSFFYMSSNLIILNPITYNNPPWRSNWGNKIKFVKKDNDD